VLHCGCRKENALRVLPSKRGELREGNRENLKHKNGNHEKSDTCGGERKIGVIIEHRTCAGCMFNNVTIYCGLEKLSITCQIFNI